MNVPLTVIVLTLNEERNLTHALECVKGRASRICVVDSFSSDNTVEICRSLHDVHLVQHTFKNYAKQWNWALDNLPVETEWVMKLDADERLTPGIRREIEEAIKRAADDVAGFAVWRKFVFMGKVLKHTVGKCYDVRIWRRGRGRFEGRCVNEHLVVDGRVLPLAEPLIHEDRKGLSAWVWRHNRYSSMEAVEFFCKPQGVRPQLAGRGVAFRRFLKDRLWRWVPFRPLAYFIYLYVVRLGFLDGREGLAYAKLRCFYHYLIELKKREYQVTGEVSRPDIMG